LKTLLKPDEFEALRQEVYRLTGVTLADGKLMMLSGRVRRHMNRLGLTECSEYLRQIRQRGEAQDHFVDAVTTHKTSLFRTTSVWNRLIEELLPELASQHTTVRLWSGAASRGHEPASLAIACEHVARGPLRMRWSVLATDVSPGMVTATRAACFEQAEIREASLRFPRIDIPGSFERARPSEPRRLKSGLRGGLCAAQHNLLSQPPSVGFHMIFLRNVIIYFSQRDKVQVIQNARRALVDGGVLVIGESEALLKGEAYGLEYIDHCFYRRVA